MTNTESNLPWTLIQRIKDLPFVILLNFLITTTDMITLAGIDPNMISNNLTPFEPTHPGEILREEIECRGITQTKLANELGIKVSLLNELINGKRDFTIEYALMLEAALGIDSDFWINLQNDYSKARAKHDTSFMTKLSGIQRIAAVL